MLNLNGNFIINNIGINLIIILIIINLIKLYLDDFFIIKYINSNNVNIYPIININNGLYLVNPI